MPVQQSLSQQPSSSIPQHLQQELLIACQQRDQAQAEASQWRQRYQVEAQQRRQEVECAEATIQQLRAELQQLAHTDGQDLLTLAPAAIPSDSPIPQSQDPHQELSDPLAAPNELIDSDELAEELPSTIQKSWMPSLRASLKARSQHRQRRLTIPASRLGTRAGSIIRKDRANCQAETQLA